MPELPTMVQERLTYNSWGLLGSQGYVLGLDLGSYGLRAALIDLQSQEYFSVHKDTAPSEAPMLVEQAITMARGLLADHGLRSDHLVRIGVGFGGPVDMRQGLVRLSPRYSGWENFPLREQFEQAFDCTVIIDNDANLMALAEATFGVGKECDSLCYMHISSGVGCGLVLDGRLYHGATATAGEIGHAVVRGGGGAPDTATLEDLVSIRGLLQRAGELGLQTDNLEDIFADQPPARQVIDEAVEIIAMRLSAIITLLDPEMLVLGGVVVRIGGDRFVERIGSLINNYIAPKFARPVNIHQSLLGFDSVAIGGLALALESLRD
jgi:glucokinase